MRVLVVGAGAIGGYFGGRLLQAGRDVTFLVRPRRANELADTGLIIKSPRGDISIRKPATILSESIGHTFDLVVLSCKAYDLAGAIDSFAAAVGPETIVLPLQRRGLPTCAWSSITCNHQRWTMASSVVSFRDPDLPLEGVERLAGRRGVPGQLQGNRRQDCRASPHQSIQGTGKLGCDDALPVFVAVMRRELRKTGPF
jgi:hypothetical protein